MGESICDAADRRLRQRLSTANQKQKPSNQRPHRTHTKRGKQEHEQNEVQKRNETETKSETKVKWQMFAPKGAGAGAKSTWPKTEKLTEKCWMPAEITWNRE